MEDINKLVENIKVEFAHLVESQRASAEVTYKLGIQLAKLKDGNVYRFYGKGITYGSWKEFVDDELPFSVSYANRLIAAVRTQDKLEQNQLTEIKQPEAILTLIRKQKGNQLKEVWNTAVGNDKNRIPTRKAIKEALGDPLEPKKDEFEDLLDSLRRFERRWNHDFVLRETKKLVEKISEYANGRLPDNTCVVEEEL